MLSGVALYECVLCREKFSERDIQELRYFASTQTCLACYERGQKASYVVWCFGKRSIVSAGGHVLEYGYDEKVRACDTECPDRHICRLFVTGALGGVVGTKGPLLCPFAELQSMTARAWVMCTKGVMIEDLVQWVRNQGGDPARILRIMRAGERRNFHWHVDEQNGFLKITDVGQR